MLYKKLFGRINHHQSLLNEYILDSFFAFLSNIINCQEQLKTMQQTEIKKKYTFFLGEDFFFFSVFSIAFNCSWQLIMFNKKQKSCVKRFQLVTDNFLFERKASYKVKIVFIHHL